MESQPSVLSSLITLFILLGICVLGFFIRLFAIIRFESIIHEFDPWFNYRATEKFVTMGFYDFLNWFDETAWYPLGRVVGGTVYPGLMLTAGGIHTVLNGLGFTTHIQDVCVFTAPIFSGFTAVSTYLLTKEAWSAGAGLLAAVFIGINPSYASRSVGGSFDNEGIAIFALQFSFFLWLKALKTGSVIWSILLAVSYMYMTSAWGGYVFIINLIALHAFVMVLIGRFSVKLYVAFTTFYCVGQLMAMNIPFVGFQPVTTSEHMAGFGVFGLLQLVAFMSYLEPKMGRENIQKLFKFIILLVIGVGIFGIVALTSAGYIHPWNGRFYSLWDTGYAIVHLPLIASVSEHQPTQYAQYFNDLSCLPLFGAAGLIYCFKRMDNGCLFMIIYAMFSAYFSGIMVRLMLALSPILCILASISISSTIETIMQPNDELIEIEIKQISQNDEKSDQNIDSNDDNTESNSEEKTETIIVKKTPLSEYLKNELSITKCIALFAVFGACGHYAYHSEYIIENFYSSPSIILTGRVRGNEIYVIDDFREAYSWLRTNTDENSSILSWWDYGYQIAGMADRNTIVDNNTWNNTHIALIGKFMASDEKKAHALATELGADYILMIFGGWLGFGGDDMNKFLWMVRISEAQWPKEIVQQRFFSKRGRYEWGDGLVSDYMEKSTMYRLSYAGFGQQTNPRSGKNGYDMVRNYGINTKKIKLKYFEEVYSTKELLVRVYRVKTPNEISRSNFLRKKKKILRKTKLANTHNKYKIDINPTKVKRSKLNLVI